MSQPLRIATRESRLALWQAEHVRARLQVLWPHRPIVLVPMTTRGDQILDRTLSKVGGKGLFIRELEQALLDDRADLAVHSLKDVPMVLPENFQLAAMLARENPHDAFVSNTYAQLADLPEGAKVGTASLRRTAMIQQHYPHVQVETLRGNLDTRIRKLDDGHYDAIILACAGLIRMNYAARIRQTLPVATFLPSPGQGTIGIEIRRDDVHTLTAIQPLICHATTLRCKAERAFAEVLQGGCEVPLAAFATLQQQQLTLEGWVADLSATQVIRQTQRAHLPLAQPELAAEQLGQTLAAQFLAAGAEAILSALRTKPH